jgi:glutaminyl-peptide cyclotransferase
LDSTPSSGSSPATRRAIRSLTLSFLLALAAVASCGRPAAAFEGKRAFEWLTKQCDMGPRVPGTTAHDSCFAFLVSTLRGFTSHVETDTFSYDSPALGKEVRLMNVVARFRPEIEQRVVLGAHWDTRAWADRDPIPARRTLPVLGANDGASGVAVLLELARHLGGRNPPTVGVDIVLFDGEDLGTEADPNGWFRGSHRYVEWSSSRKAPLFVIIVDMVGKKNLALHWEGYSRAQAANVVDLVWEEARALGVRSFRSDVKHSVMDDHIPFLNAGIPAIDLIDFDYPEWHTTRDTPDKCSPESLEGVGRVLLSLITKPGFLHN